MTSPVRPAPTSADYSSEASTNTAIEALYQFFQPLQMPINTGAPLAAKLKEGQPYLQDDRSSVRRIYIKMNGVVYYWNASGNL